MFQLVDPKPNFPKLEEEILAFWEKEKIFEKSLEKNRPDSVIARRKPLTKQSPRSPRGRLAARDDNAFVFYDGPPFATGLPHYGHILASTIKDVIPRYQTMQGRYVRRRWGWDCHGLPIEEIVERLLKISGKKQIEEIGIKKFNETCRSKVLEYVSEWRKTVRRIARWVDFDNSYKTMDRDYMESVWWAFKQIYDKGLVYEGRKVLLYCPRCETPVSNFEVAMDNSYKDVTEEAVVVKFKVKTSPPPLLGKEGKGEVYLLAWTTTPWTLPGNVALAVGEKITYVIFKFKTQNSKLKITSQNAKLENYIIAKDRLSSVIPDTDPESSIEITTELKGRDLVGLEYEPLFDIPALKNDKSFRIYDADFVNTEEGTGIVHTAVVYGEDDYALGLKAGLPVVPLLDEKGVFNEQAPGLIRGKYFKDAEKAIKDDLEKRGLIFERKTHTHSYPHCWRCENELFYNAIPAWFINIQKIKKKLLASNKKEINWYPEHLKFGRYAKSVEAAPDWNISRNRYWGNPIPVWRCEQCQKHTVVGSVAELKEKAITGFKNDLDLHRPYIDEVILKCAHCGAEAKRITEIFDSWVEAGSMPIAAGHWPFAQMQKSKIKNQKLGIPENFPADFVSEYIAQTRAWFYVMHVISLVLFGKAPFENVVTTGTILAEDGSKMSKSKENYPDPWKVMEKYGVDSLRFYLMNSVVMQADNLNFSEKELATTHRKVVLILWNVYNYFVTYANASSAIDSFSRHPESRPNRDEGSRDSSAGTPQNDNILDQWILARLQELINSVTKNLDNYDTVHATREIESFIGDLSTWYVRRSRGRLDEGFFSTLHHCLLELSKVIAPFMPFLSEEIYRNLVKYNSNDTNRYPNDPNGSQHSDIGSPGSDYISVHLARWPESKKLTKKQAELLSQMAELRKIVEQVHALRAKAGVKLRQPLKKLKVKSEKIKVELEQILKDEVNVKEIVYGDALELDTDLSEDLKLEGLTAELTRQIQSFRKDSGLKIGEMAELLYYTASDIMESAINLVDQKKTYLSSISKLKDQKSKLNIEKEIMIDAEKIVLRF